MAKINRVPGGERLVIDGQQDILKAAGLDSADTRVAGAAPFEPDASRPALLAGRSGELFFAVKAVRGPSGWAVLAYVSNAPGAPIAELEHVERERLQAHNLTVNTEAGARKLTPGEREAATIEAEGHDEVVAPAVEPPTTTEIEDATPEGHKPEALPEGLPYGGWSD